MFFQKITEEKAIKIAERDSNLPTAINRQVRDNFKKANKNGMLSFISLEDPTAKLVTKEGKEYWEVIFHSGEISWQELSADYKQTEIYFDGDIKDDKLAKCLISVKGGKFTYTGICNIGPLEDDK